MKIIIYPTSTIHIASIFFQLAVCKKYGTKPYYNSTPDVQSTENFCFANIIDDDMSFIEDVDSEIIDKLYILRDSSNMSILRKCVKNENIDLDLVRDFVATRQSHLEYIQSKFGDVVEIIDIDLTDPDYKSSIMQRLELSSSIEIVENIYFKNIKQFIKTDRFEYKFIDATFKGVNEASNKDSALEILNAP